MTSWKDAPIASEMPVQSSSGSSWQDAPTAGSEAGKQIIKQGPKAEEEAQKPKQEFGEAFGAFGQLIAQGGSFGLADDIGAEIAAPLMKGGLEIREALTGEEAPTYQDLRAIAHSNKNKGVEQFREENPGAAFGAEMSGGLMTGGAMLKSAPAMLQGAENLVRRVPGIKQGANFLTKGNKVAPGITNYTKDFIRAHPILGTAGVAGASGGAYGFGAGEGPLEDRLENARNTAMFSAAVGPISYGMVKAGGAGLNYAGSKLGPVSERVAKYLGLKQRSYQQPTRPVQDIVDEATSARMPDGMQADEFYGPQLKKIEKAIRKDFPGQADELIEAWKKGDLSLAELNSPRLTRLAKGSAQFEEGEVRAKAFFDKKLPEKRGNMVDAASEMVAARQTADDLDGVIEGMIEEAKPIYKGAYDANPSMKSNVLDRILDRPEAKAALKTVSRHYQDAAQLTANPDPDLTALAKELSDLELMDPQKGGVAAGLKLRTLDKVKQELDKMVVQAKKAAQVSQQGADVNKYKAYESVRRSLVNELDRLDESGLYEQARKKAGDYKKLQEAYSEGVKHMGQKTPNANRAAKKFYEGLTDSEKKAYRIGVGEYMNQQVANIGQEANPYNVLFDRGGMHDKLRYILKPDEFNQYDKIMRANKQLFDMRNEVLGGSPTTGKAIAAAEVAGMGADIAEVAATGMQNIPKMTVLKSLKLAFQGINDKTAGKISDILYETDPVKKLAIIKGLNKDLNPQEARKVKQYYFEAEQSIYQDYIVPMVAGQAAVYEESR